MKFRTIFPFLLVFVLAVLVRALVWWFYVDPMAQRLEYAPFLFPDSLNFYEYARNLAGGSGYIDEAGRMAWRMPGYSFLLAGPLRAGIDSIGALHVINFIVGGINALLACWLGGALFSRRAGILAGVGVALYPFMVFMDTLLLADTLAVTALLLLALAGRFFVNARGFRAKVLAALAVGAVAAFAAYVKASLGLLLVVLLPFLLVARRERRRGSPGVSWALCALAGFCILMLPWWLRNQRVFGDFVPFSTMGGFTLWEATGPGADGGPNHGKVAMPPAWELMQEGLRNEGSALMPLTHGVMTLTFPLPGQERDVMTFYSDTRAELASDAYLMAACIRHIRAMDSGELAELTLRKFLRTWVPVPNWVGAGFWPYGLLMLISYVPVMFLAGAGVIFLRHNWREVYILLIPALYLSGIHAVFMGSVRYRLPALGCLIVLAAGMADCLLRGQRNKPPTDGQ